MLTLAERFSRLFEGYEFKHGRFRITGRREDGKVTGEATTEDGPATPALWQLHLDGVVGLGVIPIRGDDTCLWGAVDLDIYDHLDHRQVAGQLSELRIPALIAQSKSAGGHVCLFAAEPIPAELFQQRLTEICLLLGFEAKEIFPKQSTHTECGGNWVNCVYFQGAESTRNAYKPNGDVYNPEGFLDAAEALKTLCTREWFETPLSMSGVALPAQKPTSAKKKGTGFTLPDRIPLGVQDNTLTAFAGSMRRAGADEKMILAALKQANERCEPRVLDKDLERIARSVARYEPGGANAGGGFVERPDGIYHVSTAQTGERKGEQTSVFVAAPIFVTAYARTAENEAWSMMLTFVARDGFQHELVMKTGEMDLPGNRWLARLKELGLRVGDSDNAKALLKKYLESRRIERWIRLVERVGWSSDCAVYMLPAGPVPAPSEDANEQYVFKNHGRKHIAHFGTKGTLAEWRDNVGRYCVGNSRLLFCTSAAFLGPALRPWGVGEGKAFHYFFDTSRGKTTALMTAGSVCGGGTKLGFLQTWNATANSMESIAEQHNDAFLGLDELGLMDARKIGTLAYIVVGGQGKGRLNRDAEMREQASWLNVTFSSGELSLEAHMKTGDPDSRLFGGQEVRLLNVSGDTESGYGVFENLHEAPSAAEFADMLKRNVHQYYGTALVAWVKALAERRAELTKRAADIVGGFRVKFARDAGPQVGRAAESFALVAAAGEIASGEGITGWPEGAATEAAATCFAAWRKDRDTEGSSDENNMLKQVRHFFQAHGASRFEKLFCDEKYPRVVVNRAGFVAQDEFLVLDRVFEDEICRGFDYKRVVKLLAKLGYLITTKDGQRARYKVDRKIPGQKSKARVYALRSAILIDSSHDQPVLVEWPEDEAA